MPALVQPAYSYSEFDTNDLDIDRRQALWQAIAPHGMQSEPFRAPGTSLRIRLRRLNGPSVRFADVAASPIKLDRRIGRIGCDSLDLLRLLLVVRGDLGMLCEHAASETIARSGQIMVRDFTQPARGWWPTSEFRRVLVLQLPHSALQRDLGEGISRLHGVELSNNGLAPLLKAQFTTLAEIAARLDPAAQTAALEATRDLAISTLRLALGTHIEDGLIDTGLFAAARVYISRNLGSTRLNPELIARQLGCSRAHLYQVFARHGETVADYVRGARLLRARELLVSGAGRQETIGDVAFRCGFADPAHFARLFRERFGMTPTAAVHGDELRRDAD